MNFSCLILLISSALSFRLSVYPTNWSTEELMGIANQLYTRQRMLKDRKQNGFAKSLGGPGNMYADLSTSMQLGGK